MPLKFAANISTMFSEYGNHLPSRYKAAKEANFKGIECQFPYQWPVEDIQIHKKVSGLTHVLLNSYKGETEQEFGFALKSEEEFVKSLDTTLIYAKALNCKRVHVIAGLCSNKDNASFDEEKRNYIHNLKLAAQKFKENDIIGVIEPLCKQVKQDYFLSSFSKAVEYLKEVDSQHMKLLMDVFHLQMIHGNLSNNIRAMLPHIGHVQISQAPNRNEPSAPGEVNYKYILSVLESSGYDGWVGLEYFPSGNTDESLSWIKEYGYQL